MKLLTKICFLVLCTSILMVNAVTISDLKSPYPIERQKMPLEHEKDIKTIIDLNAKKYSVSGQIMARTIEKESNYQNIQSNLKYETDHPEWGVRAGDRELSFGVCQIHLPTNPTITKEQALNPEFCIDFMAREFSKGNACKWYGYRIVTGNC